MFGFLITSRTALQESMIVAHSRLMIVIRSRDLFLRYFRVPSTTESGARLLRAISELEI